MSARRRSLKSRSKSKSYSRSKKRGGSRGSKSSRRGQSKSKSSRRGQSKSKSSRRGQSKSKSPRDHSSPSSFKGTKNSMNNFFDRIFIINLKDKTERFNKIAPRFIKKDIKYTRFNAIDGRCDKKDYKKKTLELEEKYDIKIANKINPPTASLVIGTIQILRNIVKNKWKSVLILEDDVIPVNNILKKFSEGVEELEDEVPDWDVLYLGCGNQCGYRGISENKTSQNKHLTSLSIVDKDTFNYYVQNKNDLRVPCESDYCEKISKNLSYSPVPGGCWAYAYSLKGAKKMLKILNDKVSDHIDQTLMKYVERGKLKAVSFDPPIIYHEAGAYRPDSDIPWNW